MKKRKECLFGQNSTLSLVSFTIKVNERYKKCNERKQGEKSLPSALESAVFSWLIWPCRQRESNRGGDVENLPAVGFWQSRAARPQREASRRQRKPEGSRYPHEASLHGRQGTPGAKKRGGVPAKPPPSLRFSGKGAWNAGTCPRCAGVPGAFAALRRKMFHVKHFEHFEEARARVGVRV